jgi:hypothetical protein
VRTGPSQKNVHRFSPDRVSTAVTVSARLEGTNIVRPSTTGS